MLKFIQNQKGSAVFETIPILLAFILLLSFSFGFFGAIHTGILNSIAARNYAFETFRHRPNLVYFKDTSEAPSDLKTNYLKVQTRHHGIGNEFGTNSLYRPSQRPIDKFGLFTFNSGDNPNTHNIQVRSLNSSRRNSSIGIETVWLKTVYGICITAKCEE